MRDQPTPGPWTIFSAPNLTSIVTPKGEMKLTANTPRAIQCDLQEWLANARLMAASRELLDALQRLAAMAQVHNDKTGYFNDLNPYEVFNIISPVIRKATTDGSGLRIVNGHRFVDAIHDFENCEGCHQGKENTR